MADILVVDAARAETESLVDELTQSGHEVTLATTGRQAVEQLSDGRAELVILDHDLPDMSGTELVRTIRSNGRLRAVPLILMSEQGDEIDRVVAFEVGVDDFVVRPFSKREVALRVRAILRRRRPQPALAQPSAMGNVELDPVAHRVLVGGDEVPLSALEFKLLAVLYQRRPRVQSRDALLSSVWGVSDGVSHRTVDACVKRLRQKLGVAGPYVQTVRGVGYRFIALDELRQLE
ncbi:MAG: response regulator transcription factor [Polyangiaceae bacterium]